MRMQLGEVRPCRVRQGLTSNAKSEIQSVKYKKIDPVVNFGARFARFIPP